MNTTTVPNTDILVPLADISKTARLHVGLPTFLDSFGVGCASYQLLDEAGAAIASCFITGGVIEETVAADCVDISVFHHAALTHFRSSPQMPAAA